MSTRTNNLVALGSAAVVAIYAAGFVRTREAAARFSDDGSARRPTPPVELIAEQAVVPSAVPTAASPASLDTALMQKDASSAVAVELVVDSTTVAPKPASSPAPIVAAQTSTSPVAKDSSTTVSATVSATDSATVAGKDSIVVWKDGVYLGWGGSRHGDIQAEVAIRGGRIVSASIAQCLTRYSCSWIEALPAQVVVRQSADVDYVSGATQSANAFYYAVTDALSKAK